MRVMIAKWLRAAAFKFDGDVEVSRWHRVSVETMNRYIASTEGYIAALEGVLPKLVVDGLRTQHARPNQPKREWL